MYKLAYLVTHPIQYQAPLLRLLHQHEDVDLHVFFLSDFSAREYVDQGFGRKVEWDVNVLEGYKYSVLGHGRYALAKKFSPLLAVKVIKAIEKEAWDAIWFHGYAHGAQLLGLLWALIRRKKVFFRGESNLICTSRGRFKDYFVRFLIQRAKALLYIGTANKKYYEQFGAELQKLFFVPYAVDNERFRLDDPSVRERARARFGLADSSPVFLYVGKLSKRKRADLLLAAFSSFARKTSKEAGRLLIVGEGELGEHLRRIVEQEGLTEQVTFLGFRNQKELVELYALADVFVIPSENEPFGLVLNEAMNGENAVIASSEVGGAFDLVQEGKNGVIFTSGSAAELEEAIAKLTSSAELRKQYGRASRELVAEFSFEKDVQGILAALKA